MEDDVSSGDDGGGLEQALHAVRERRLAAPALAGESEDLAALQLEGDVLDGGDGRVDVIHDGEVAHGQQWFGHGVAFGRAGSVGRAGAGRFGCRGRAPPASDAFYSAGVSFVRIWTMPGWVGSAEAYWSSSDGQPT